MSERTPHQRRATRPRNWLVAGAALVVVVAVAAALTMIELGGDPDEPDPQGPTAWDQLRDRYLDDGLTTQLALDAFATMVGPIPGGEAVAADLLGASSAAAAVRWMLARWDDLDDAQRTTFREFVYGPAAGGQAAGARAPVTMALVPQQASPAAADLQAQLQDAVEQVADDFTDRTGLSLPRLRVVVSATPDDNVYADARYRVSAAPGSPRGQEQPATCVITFYPDGLEALVADRGGGGGGEFAWITAHELYHCYQYRLAEPDLDRVHEGPLWIIEGTAEFAGSWYAAQAHPGYVTAEWWGHYHAWPYTWRDTSLYRLSYDALGFFAHLDNTLDEGDIWAALDAVILAPSNADAFTAAVDAGGDTFLPGWAPGMFYDPTMGDPWASTGPAMPDLGPATLDAYQLTGRDPVTVTADPAPAVVRARVSLDGDVAVVRAEISGHGAFHWFTPTDGGRTEWFDTQAPEIRWYCLTGVCDCGDGQDAFEPATDVPVPSAVAVALAGGKSTATALLTALSVDELCDEAVPDIDGCADVFAVVNRHAPVYDTHRQVLSDPGTGITLCSVTYTESPELDEFGDFTRLGVFQEIQVSFTTQGGDLALCTDPEGYCVQRRTQRVPAQPGVPAFDVVHTDVTTRHVMLNASEEAHGTVTPVESLITIARAIQAGLQPAE